MPEPSDDMLMALADDQLPEAAAQPLLALIAADPALAARYAVFTDTRAALQAAFAAGPVPEALVRAIRNEGADPVVVPFRPRKMFAPVPLALAASLLLAVGFGGFMVGRGAPGATGDPGVMAAAQLSGAVTGDEAALEGGGAARVLGSYQTDAGLCRLLDLTLPGDRAERAVVCRQQAGDWAVVAAVAAGQGEAYIPASDLGAELIDQVLDDLGAGPALDSAAEATALGL
jgi:hypothetical protein